MKLTQLFLCTAALALPLSLSAATQKNNDRWFEVEVILFSQLGDKSQLKENFPEQAELPHPPYVEDLLSKYLNPDIASLKQLLPSCDSPQASTGIITQHAKLPALFSEKSLTDIAQLAPSPLTSQGSSTTLGEYGDSTASFNNKLTDDTLTPQQGINTTERSLATTLEHEADNNVASDAINVLSVAEQAQQQALVLAAEQKFNPYKFQYNDKVSNKLLCKINEKHFADIKAEDRFFSYNGFDIAKVPLRIIAEEDLNNNNTHLLGKASLKLGDVIQDLRYSKNFRPILHMGWRQVARPKKQSVPVRVFAGDNFALDYKKQLAHYQQSPTNLPAELVTEFEPEINQQIADGQIADNVVINSETLALEQFKQARIAEIVAQMSSVPENVDALLERLKSDNLSRNINQQSAPMTTAASAPVPPIQEWLIDGLFNIHLKHYLFITADFSILDKNLSELAATQLQISENTGENITQSNDGDTFSAQAKVDSSVHAKAIRFQQNRRVISGEVHYFDHPYMGMIVQIRPYKKPEKEEIN